MIEKILFLAAFFSIIWFLKLFLFWIFVPAYSNEKIAAKKRYAEYSSKEGIGNEFLKWLFVIFNSDILFPAKGAMIALVFMVAFIVYSA
ncbi:hypothetical protein JWZ98_02360 [Methylomonas sp. EFPC1]|uniref:hypothetical protein n=1 Tax=Methylomonas sp. EFPC1 TaxID=2812647 RepID=UPI001967FA4D|nr:hypothetical protein [Methylomonas sp. EFPC1]QSB01824.1 hypothetical protein JWZ98_02360 [Methylomonas sp. EFPC1]